MRKHAETFHANKDCKLIIVYSISISPFSKEKFRVQLSNVICTKTGPSIPLLPLLLYENQSIRHCLSYDLKRMAMVLVLEVQVFQGVRFVEDPFFLSSRARVRVRFLDGAQNDEQFQKLQEQGEHIAMMAVFRHFKQVYLW